MGFPWSRSRANTALHCAVGNYTARILMHDPFMMHIENFISTDERAYLLDLGYGLRLLPVYLAYCVIARRLSDHRKFSSKMVQQP